MNRAIAWSFPAALVALISLYHVGGVSVWHAESARSLFGWLYFMWTHESSEAVDYSHGLVIPVVAAWLLWRKRADLRVAFRHPVPHFMGVALWSFALLLHAAGLRMQIPHLSALSLILALWAGIWTFCGVTAAKLTLFPLAFLSFAIPVAFLAQATFPLRLFGSVVSVGILNGIGIPTVRHGTALFSEMGQGFAMDVADACSGIRSIMALMALTAGYAYCFRRHPIGRWCLFLMSVPIATAANIGRILTIALIALFAGQEAGMRWYHDYSGYLVFALAVLLVMGINAVMDRVAARFFHTGHDGLNARKGCGEQSPSNPAKAAIPVMLWAGLLVAAVPLTRLAADVTPAHPLPEHWRLPLSIGDWVGEGLYYSTAPEIARFFTESEVGGSGLCPVSGYPLDRMSPDERRLLPSDIEIERRLYRQDDNQRLVILLITGSSREGIHRPEWCLAAQGIPTGRRFHIRVSDGKGGRFTVGVYPMFDDGTTAMVEQGRRYYVYWYEGPAIRTPHNAVRILRMGWDRLLTGRVQRWAYFSIQMAVPEWVNVPERHLVEAVEWLVQGQ